MNVAFVLSIDNTSLDTVFIYRVLPGGLKQTIYQGGNLMPYDEKRNYVWHTAPIYLMRTPAYYLIAVKSLSQNVNFNYQILKTDEFQRLYQSFDRLIYFYIGFVSLISSICIVGIFLFRKKALLVYIGYILSISAWIVAHYGYLFPLLYPSVPFLNSVIKQVTSLIAMLCLLNLITLSLKKYVFRKLVKPAFLLLKSTTAVLLIFFITHLIPYFHSVNLILPNVIWNIHLLVSTMFISLVSAALFRNDPAAKLFTLAISFVLFAAVFQIFSNIGWVHSQFFNDHGMLIASMLETLVLAMGVFYNVWKEKLMQEEELQTAQKERSRALQMLITVQDDERKRIAADLHDSIGPMLAAIKINFIRLAKSKPKDTSADILMINTENIIDETISEMRNIAHQLMPKGLSTKGLISLLSDYLTNLEDIYSLRICFNHDINVSLGSEMQLNLYRIICELSLNAAKHSSAKTLWISVKTEVSKTLVNVTDDGKGFTNEGKDSPALGLRNVKSRVEYLGGQIDFESSGRGTNISIRIPNEANS